MRQHTLRSAGQREDLTELVEQFLSDLEGAVKSSI